MDNNQLLLGALLLIVLYFVFIHNTEKLENISSSPTIIASPPTMSVSSPPPSVPAPAPQLTSQNITPAPVEEKPQTIFGVRNAFTGLRCYDDNLPIVSVDSNTFTCISKDGVNCLTRDQLLIPKETQVNNGKLVKSTVLCRNVTNRNVTTWQVGNPYNIGDSVIYKGRAYIVINNIPADKTSLVPSHKDAERFWKKADDINTYLAKDGIRQLAGGPSKPNTRDVFNDLDANGYYTIDCTLNGLNDTNHWCSKVYDSVNTMCNSWVNPDGTPDRFSRDSYPECSGTLQTYRDSWQKLSPAQIPPPPPVKSTLWKRPPVNVAPVPGAAPGALQISTCKNKTCLRNRPKGMVLKTCQENCNKCGETTC